MSLLLASIVLLAQPAEQFPGQVDLAAGIACWKALDAECARSRLEEALEKFSPEKDPDYMEHVRLARWTLALIRVAGDDLAGAEKQLKMLLLLDPAFKLPPGEHPPKIRYIFQQAREEIDKRRRTAKRPPLSAEAVEQAAAEKEPPPGSLPPPAPPPKSESASAWFLGGRGQLLVLWGRDAQALYPGGGAALELGLTVPPRFRMALELAWTRHEGKGAHALQHFNLGVAGEFFWPAKAVELALRGSVSALAMGIPDRYDNFGALLAAGASLAWPGGRWMSLQLLLMPAVALAPQGASFLLLLGLGGRLEW